MSLQGNPLENPDQADKAVKRAFKQVDFPDTNPSFDQIALKDPSFVDPKLIPRKESPDDHLVSDQELFKERIHGISSIEGSPIRGVHLTPELPMCNPDILTINHQGIVEPSVIPKS